MISMASAQIYDPVDWKNTAVRISATEAEVTFLATIEKGWHLYSQNIEGDGPVPTLFDYKTFENSKLLGKTLEPEGYTEFDPNFEITVTYHENEVAFVQTLKVGEGAAKLGGELTFMVCNDERCLPPEYIDFSFNIPAWGESEAIAAELQSSEDGHEVGSHDEGGILEPVEWSFDQKNLGNGEYELSFTASIEQHWHLYSQVLPEETMTLPTVFEYDSVIGAELVGKTEEPAPITQYDPVAEMTLSYFEESVTFRQKVKLNGEGGRVVGAFQFMVCDETKCLAPEWVDFSFDLGSLGASAVAESFDSKESKEDKSWIGIFIAGFLGGLLALLTPCVFPMIPLTVSFFTKQSKTKAKGVTNAIIYGLSIIGIYVFLGLVVTLSFGPDALNALSTNVWFNMFFFLLLAVFAFSFLGAFEITLPSSWINKADSAADKGGLIGIFFMAFTLSLVSFSCTGPIIGTLLVEAAVNGGVLGPTMGMVGFSSALALPFALFAAFPGWLNTMPKSGGWLNAVKVSLGFLELALAFKFLSNADLVAQAGWLQRELFLAIWIGIFGIWALYLLGFIVLSHDSKSEGIGTGRLLMGVFVSIFTIYLIPGLWGAPLKIISGFPPPMFYSEAPNGFGGGSGGGGHTSLVMTESGDIVGDPEHCPHGLPCFHDYDEGMAYAKEVGKPVMLDFTGWACVNCRKMEEQVWSDPRVLKRLREDYVLVSLYVDEKLELPREEQIEVTIGTKTKKLKTVGNKWSYVQATRFGTNSQPYYVVLDHEENQIGPPAAYNPDIDLYIKWLDDGLIGFASSH
jgi:thiol:disulfide interchange protein DsbD